MTHGQWINDAMRHALAELAVNPGEETYRKLRALVVGHPGYAPYSEDLKTLNSLYGEKRYEQVLEKFRDMMPNWMLNQSAHQLACLASKHLGNQQTAALELQLAEACLQGVLASGDGSRERPYPVTHVEDEYDVLRRLKKTVRQQSLMNSEGAQFDCIECEDGSTLWFDVTELLAHLKT